MTDIRVAVVGAGHIGRIHARLAAQTAGIQLTAIVDPDPLARQSLAAEFAITALEHHRQLASSVDAAILAVPASLHATIARDLLNAGLHLLIEKPLATTTADAQELVQIATDTRRVLQVGHVERWNPAWQAVRNVIPQPKFIDIQRLAPHAFRANDVGVVLDLMIHDLDLLIQQIDSDVVRVSASGISLLEGHEDFAQARLEFQNGAVAQLTSSRVHPATVRRWQLVGSDIICLVDLHQRSAEIIRPAESSEHPAWRTANLSADRQAWYRDHLFDEVLLRHPLPILATNPIAMELEGFVAAIGRGRSERTEAMTGCRAVALAERILESLRANGEPVHCETRPLRRAG